MTATTTTPETTNVFYFDGNGALIPTKLGPYCVNGEATVALTINKPFHRVRKSEYEDTVKKLNALPPQVRERYIALIKAQMKCDMKEKGAKQLTFQEYEDYSALVLKHGLPPYNPHIAIAMDYLYNAGKGAAKMYDVGGRPVHEDLVGKPVVVSFCMQSSMQGRRFGDGNLYELQRLAASYQSAHETGDTTGVESQLRQGGVDPQTAKKSVIATLPIFSKLVH